MHKIPRTISAAPAGMETAALEAAPVTLEVVTGRLVASHAAHLFIPW